MQESKIYIGAALAIVVVLLIVGFGLVKMSREQPKISKSEQKRKRRNKR